MKSMYNDLKITYCDMKNQRQNMCNEIFDLMAKRQQLDEDITRIEYILSEYGLYQEAGFTENKAESEE